MCKLHTSVHAVSPLIKINFCFNVYSSHTALQSRVESDALQSRVDLDDPLPKITHFDQPSM